MKKLLLALCFIGFNAHAFSLVQCKTEGHFQFESSKACEEKLMKVTRSTNQEILEELKNKKVSCSQLNELENQANSLIQDWKIYFDSESSAAPEIQQNAMPAKASLEYSKQIISLVKSQQKC